MRSGYEHKGWRLTLTEIVVATERDDVLSMDAGDTDENAVLMIEGPAATVAAALTLVGQLTGVDGSVSVQVAPGNGEPVASFVQPLGGPARVVADQDANRYAPDDDKPRRTRRTKAQVQADKLAAEQGAQNPIAAAPPGETPSGLEPMRPFVPIASPAATFDNGPAPAGYSPFG